MTVGAMRIELFISDANSLKDKRTVIKALKDRVRNNFNVSISEIDDHDKWQKASLGVSNVGPDRRYVNGTLDRVLEFVRRDRRVQVLDFEMEIS